MNAKTRLLTAYRAIGPDTVNRLMSLGELSAHTREDVFSQIARSETGTHGTPRQADIDRYGQAAYVYAALHTHWREIAAWTGKRDGIAEMAKAAALAGVPVSELTDLELGCRVYTAIVERDLIPGDIVKEITDRPKLPQGDVAAAIGLSVQGYHSTGLIKWRDEGITARSGTGQRAFWGWWRDVGDFKAGSNP